MEFSARKQGLVGVALVGVLALAACAAPAPTATPTTAPVAAPTPTKAAPTPTKAPTATPTKRPLVKFMFGTSTESLSFAPLYLALAKGFFREEGLDAEWMRISGSAKITAAVVAGDIQIGSHVFQGPLQALDQGLPVQIVGGYNKGVTSQTVMRRDVADHLSITAKSPLKDKVQALKGLTIVSTSKGGDTDLVLRWLLLREGIDPQRDMDMTYIATDADGVAAFKRGAVQAMSYAPPASTQVLDSGEAIMLINWRKGDVPELADRLANTLTVNREYAPQHRDIIESAVRAIWRSVRLMWDSKEDARRTLRNFEQFRDQPEASFNDGFELQYDNL
ncbi:MAG: ABC transporter substrate-binding protein [Chloroflexi bacterium]|nr:ABC transporter substrate-binding protein [Chloroflexota bacterium]